MFPWCGWFLQKLFPRSFVVLSLYSWFLFPRRAHLVSFLDCSILFFFSVRFSHDLIASLFIIFKFRWKLFFNCVNFSFRASKCWSTLKIILSMLSIYLLTMAAKASIVSWTISSNDFIFTGSVSGSSFLWRNSQYVHLQVGPFLQEIVCHFLHVLLSSQGSWQSSFGCTLEHKSFYLQNTLSKCSPVTYHLSPVTCHLSPVTCNHLTSGCRPTSHCARTFEGNIKLKKNM